MLHPVQTISGEIVQDQAGFNRAIARLRNSPAGMRMIRIDPMSGPIDLGVRPRLADAGTRRAASGNKEATRAAWERQALIDWVLVSAPLTAHSVQWIRDLIQQCSVSAVPICILPPRDQAPSAAFGWPEDIAIRKQPPRAIQNQPLTSA